MNQIRNLLTLMIVITMLVLSVSMVTGAAITADAGLFDRIKPLSLDSAPRIDDIVTTGSHSDEPTTGFGSEETTTDSDSDSNYVFRGLPLGTAKTSIEEGYEYLYQFVVESEGWYIIYSEDFENGCPPTLIDFSIQNFDNNLHNTDKKGFISKHYLKTGRLYAFSFHAHSGTVEFTYTFEKCIPATDAEVYAMVWKEHEGMEAILGSWKRAELSELNLYAGQYFKLEYKLLPFNAAEEKLVLTSSDPTVAEIQENGYIKIKQAGTVDFAFSGESGVLKTVTLKFTERPKPPLIKTDTTYQADLSEGKHTVRFIPEEDGVYAFVTESEMNPKLVVSGNGRTVPATADKDGRNDRLELWLKKDVEYTVTISYDYVYWLDCGITDYYVEKISDTSNEIKSVKVSRLPDDNVYITGSYAYPSFNGLELTFELYNDESVKWDYEMSNGYFRGEHVYISLNYATDEHGERDYSEIQNIKVSYMDFTVYFDGTYIDPEDIDRIEADTSRLMPLLENCDGTESSYYDPDKGEEIYFFNYDTDIIEEQTGLILYMKDGTQIKTDNISDGFLNGHVYLWADEEYWGIGKENPMTVSFAGKECTINIEIIENPVESIELIWAPQTVYSSSDGKDITFNNGRYNINPYNFKDFSLRVNYKNGTHKIFTAEDIDENLYIDGYKLNFENTYIFEGSYSDDFMQGEDVEYEAELSYMGFPITYTITVKAHTHTIEKQTAVPATSTTHGMTEGSYCTVCGNVILDQRRIWASKENEVPDTDKPDNDKPEPVKSGDVDGDNSITASDARLALRASVGLDKIDKSSKEFIAADVDKDGVLTASDARFILRVSVGLEKIS